MDTATDSWQHHHCYTTAVVAGPLPPNTTATTITGTIINYRTYIAHKTCMIYFFHGQYSSGPTRYSLWFSIELLLLLLQKKKKKKLCVVSSHLSR